MSFKLLKITELIPNEGQIEGVPKNPRFIRDARFEALKRSIKDAPEMLEYRTLGVYPYAGKYVVICGNMRLRACKELRFTEVPCYVFPERTPAEKLREYVAKDNLEFGQPDWDALANEWSTEELQRWGVEVYQNGDWANLEEIEGDIEPPNSKKGYRIIVEVSEDEKHSKDEVIAVMKEALQYYHVTIK